MVVHNPTICCRRRYLRNPRAARSVVLQSAPIGFPEQAMVHSKNRRRDARGWCGLLVLAIITSLTVSLATRFWTPSTPRVSSVKAVHDRSSEPKRQHFNADAMRWVAPAETSSFFKPAKVDSQVVPPEPTVSDPLFAQALYNRPPPSSRISL